MALCKCGKKARWMSDICDECLEREVEARVSGDTTYFQAKEAEQAAIIQKYATIEKRCTTADSIAGYRIAESHGIVRGSSIRGRAPFGGIVGTLQAMVGDEVTTWLKASEQVRKNAMARMCGEAMNLGANAIIAVRFDKEDVAAGGVMEILAYGTAVTVEPIEEKGGVA